jgi:cytidyltransferase-like protein
LVTLALKDDDVDDVDILRAIYVETVRNGFATLRGVSSFLPGRNDGDIQRRLDELADEGLVAARKKKGTRLTLTGEGRRRIAVVLIGGAFEIIHPGHVHTIREAKGLGDVLVVVVATDRTVGKNKGREPITDEATRVDLVSAIRYVDLAILGNQGSIFDTLEKVRPDIVALGYDQHHNAEEIEREGRRRGIELQTRRLSTRRPDLKTTKILAEFR